MNFRSALFSVCLAAATMHASAQQGPPQQPSPEQVKQVMQATMQATMAAMLSVMGPMTEAVIEAQVNAAAKPETAAKLAAFKRNLYEALLKQGFNGVDAMHIVVATPAPSATPSMK